jgi:hypothetical protein
MSREPKEGKSMPSSSRFRVTEVERYRIAQLFHELSRKLGEQAVVKLLQRQHGVTAEDVLAFAAEFPSEPFWRL